MITTTLRICTTPTETSQREPNTAGIRSGLTTIRPSRSGSSTAAR